MPIVKALLLLTALLVSRNSLSAQEVPSAEGVNRIGYIYPRATLRDILEVTGPLAGKKIRVADEEDLRIETTLNLPGPVTNGAVLKAISALLMLEGYELADAGKELELRRVLAPEQVKVLREGLQLPATVKQEGPVARPRAVNGKPPESWIVISPAAPKDPVPGK